MKQQATELQAMDDVEGKVIGPIPSKDGQAAQTVVTYNLGSDGWNKMPGIAKDIHKIAVDRRCATSTSPAPAARRSTPPRPSPVSTAPCCSRPSAW